MVGDSYLEGKSYIKITNQMYFFEARLTEGLKRKYVTHLRWEGYTLDWLVKWNWYFEYRAALLKVQNPRCKVTCSWGPFVPEKKEDLDVVLKMKLKKDITTAKRMRTKYFNAIEQYKKVQLKTLIPDWENPKYLKAVQKLDFYTKKLEDLENKLEKNKATV